MKTRIGESMVWMALIGLLLLSTAGAEVVGKTAQPLDSSQSQQVETTLGDVVADAVRTAVKADVAFFLGSRLRAQAIPTGNVTREQLLGALVFPEEQVVGIELKGSELQAALEWSLTRAPKKSASFLQVSGVSVTYNSEQTPRISSIRVGAAPLVAERTYRVAMTMPLAKGDAGYYRIFGTNRPIKQTGSALKDAVVSYVQSAGTITLVSGQRLRDQSPPATSR